MKLNIGSHNVRVKNFLNVDILALPEVDIVCDITGVPWKFLHFADQSVSYCEDNSVDEMLMVELLEHIPFREADKVLKEIYRVLKPGGTIHIQVPDCGSMMKMYYMDEICECVPHKPKTVEDAIGKAGCEKCGGLARVHPTRWLMAFCGAQKDYGYGIMPDIHKNIFTKERMEEALENAGFEKVDFKEDPLEWKIKVTATK